MTSFEELFYDQLLEIQAMPNSPIDGNIDVINEYHLARSFRRGATTHEQNQGVLVPDIDWINCWGSGKEQVVTGPMRVVYSEEKQLVQTFLRFSRALLRSFCGGANTEATQMWNENRTRRTFSIN